MQSAGQSRNISYVQGNGLNVSGELSRQNSLRSGCDVPLVRGFNDDGINLAAGVGYNCDVSIAVDLIELVNTAILSPPFSPSLST